ncbi:ABC transporter ATP-binding protein [Corynebacterium casei]|uniref:ABC transporter ATP-binding protein n=1 Tax=Corynebacterium casei TaxID=160386 RepID=UPI003FD65D09
MSINISDVSFSYDAGPRVLEHFSLSPVPGSVTVICGASGSGKSTALQLINGLIPHFHKGELEGSVTVEGVDVSSAPITSSGKRCATVFQNPRTQFFTTEVSSELAFSGENYGIDPQEIERRSAQALKEVGIEDLASRALSALSGGQMQKVACAQACAQETPILLFDEPTSNLDPVAIDEFAQLLQRLKSAGKTTIIVEHRLYFLKDVADDVILVADGEISQRFSAEEFFRMEDSTRRDLGLRTLETPVFHPGSVPPVSKRGLHIARLRARYGSREVLDLKDIFFPAGQVTALVGPNGAGKTTLARTLCGLHPQEKGSAVLLDGVELNPKQRLRRSFLVMQDVHRQLFSDSAADEVGDPTLLAQVDLSEVAERHPQSLSGGQKQRLVIATALGRDTDVFFFDEPTSGVDYRHLVSISAQLRALAAKGKVVVVISHDPEFLAQCCDTAITLEPLTLHQPAEAAPTGDTSASSSLDSPAHYS